MSTGSPRRRPTHRGGRPTLTREGIGRAALELVSRDGGVELTMRSLAEHLGVSPRALYNYAADRRAVLELAALVWQSDWHLPPLDPARPAESLRALCAGMRAWYRLHPRAVTIAVDENLTAAVHPRTLRNNEAILSFLVAIGLSPADAQRMYRELVLRVAAFVRLNDAWHDAPPGDLRPEVWDGTPAAWPIADPALAAELPTTRRITESVPVESVDEQFAFTVELLVGSVEALLRRDP
ncbi:TetR/AcrR family transcriptional regulator [Embleya sp. NBC_00896]|uniref:TetR/AcrR family transcriptional regulator n=1 Tax=Embleya sp. NBC_00896 TaxID=2975961 RepID=UPI0038656F55|nr:TetR/AcrR family transcriptional regulator [Embleya sp. NBC_00896]